MRTRIDLVCLLLCLIGGCQQSNPPQEFKFSANPKTPREKYIEAAILYNSEYANLELKKAPLRQLEKDLQELERLGFGSRSEDKQHQESLARRESELEEVVIEQMIRVRRARQWRDEAEKALPSEDQVK